ncbi:MAG: hypothetical protein ACI4M5_00375 [Christensenellales bacterium]
MHKLPYRPRCGTCHDHNANHQCDRHNDCRPDCRPRDCGCDWHRSSDCDRDRRRSPDCNRRPSPIHDNRGCCNDLLIGVLIGTMLGDCCHRGGDRHDR